MKVYLGGSVRQYDRQIKHREALGLRLLVDKAKARMRKNGDRPRGGVENAALDEVAEQQSLPSGDALRKMLRRHK
jgi:hypothetical protein